MAASQLEGQGDLIEAIRGLAPLVAEHRSAFDWDRRLPAPVVEALVAADLFRLWAPRRFGGAERLCQRRSNFRPKGDAIVGNLAYGA